MCCYYDISTDCDSSPLKFYNYSFSHLLFHLIDVITIILLTSVNSELPVDATKIPRVVDTSPTGIKSGCESSQVQSKLHSQLCHGPNSTGLTGASRGFLNAKQSLLLKQMLAALPLIKLPPNTYNMSPLLPLIGSAGPTMIWHILKLLCVFVPFFCPKLQK